MITTPEQYQAHLHLIQNINPPQFFPMNSLENEKLYNIDLDKRIIEAPEFLSVLEDHSSEIVYFLVDRFYDYMDLATMACLIEYVNAAGETGAYAVPFYDVQTYKTEKKMIIPWCINGQVTAAAGIVKFQVFFYSIDSYPVLDDQNQATGKYEYRYNYRLNTQIAESKVLHGMSLSSLLDIKAPEQWPGVQGEPTSNIPTNPTPEDIWLALNEKIEQLRQWKTTPTTWVIL